MVEFSLVGHIVPIKLCSWLVSSGNAANGLKTLGKTDVRSITMPFSPFFAAEIGHMRFHLWTRILDYIIEPFEE